MKFIGVASVWLAESAGVEGGEETWGLHFWGGCWFGGFFVIVSWQIKVLGWEN